MSNIKIIIVNTGGENSYGIDSELQKELKLWIDYELEANNKIIDIVNSNTTIEHSNSYIFTIIYDFTLILKRELLTEKYKSPEEKVVSQAEGRVHRPLEEYFVHDLLANDAWL